MVGAGAIGGVTAAFISKAGYDLEIVCKHKDLADKINDDGIDITGIKGNHRIRMKGIEAISDLSGPKDLIFLATKANDCVAAAKDLIPFLKLDSMVVSLQNGISEHALAEVLGKERIVGCVVGWGASNNGQGELEVTSEGEFVIGNIENKTEDDRLGFIQQLLNLVCPTRISKNIIGELYSKLIINSCINSLGVIGGVKLGQLLADKNTRKVFIMLMREAMAVANAMNIKVEPAGGGKLDYYDFLKGNGLLADVKRDLTIRMMGFKYRRIKSSSLQSLERGHRTEIDYLNGYICDKGKKCNVPTPVNNAVRKMVLDIEDGIRKMSMDNIKDLI
jgi:2-dehydropantoate 2-reductase